MISQIRYSGFGIPDSTYRIRHAGFDMPDSTCRIRHSGFDIPDSIFRVRYSGFGIPNFICRIPYVGFHISDSIFLIRYFPQRDPLWDASINQFLQSSFFVILLVVVCKATSSYSIRVACERFYWYAATAAASLSGVCVIQLG